MSIAVGQIIRASDVTARLNAVFADLYTTLASYPNREIFTQENSSLLSNITSGSEFQEKIDIILEEFGPIMNDLNNIASNLKVKTNDPTVLDGFCKLALSCYSLASNLRDTKIQYFQTRNGKVFNGMYLTDKAITRNGIPSGALEYNKNDNSAESYRTVNSYLNKFKDKTLPEFDEKSINTLSGNGTFKAGSVMMASDANKFIDFLSSLNCHIAHELSCLFGYDISYFDIIFHQSHFVGDGTGDNHVETLISGEYLTIPTYEDFGWQLSTYGIDGIDINFEGWSTTQQSQFDPLNIENIDYVPGSQILASGTGENIDLYPVCHGSISSNNVFDWSDDTNKNKLIYHLSMNFPISEISANLSTTVSFGHLSGWHNQKKSSHFGSVKIQDNNNLTKQRLTEMYATKTGWQIYYVNPETNITTAESHFKRGGGLWSFAGKTAECPEMKVSVKDGKFDISVVFERTGTNGTDNFNGSISGLYWNF